MCIGRVESAEFLYPVGVCYSNSIQLPPVLFLRAADHDLLQELASVLVRLHGALEILSIVEQDGIQSFRVVGASVSIDRMTSDCFDVDDPISASAGIVWSGPDEELAIGGKKICWSAGVEALALLIVARIHVAPDPRIHKWGSI